MNLNAELTYFREAKIRRVREHPDDADLRHVIGVDRGDQRVAMIIVGPGQRSHLDAIYLSAMCFRPDVLYFLSDAYMRVGDLEEDFKNVKSGDFERAWEAGNREGLSECLFAHGMALDGEYRILSQSYRVVEGIVPKRGGKARPKIEWDTPIEVDTTQSAGMAVDVMREGWARRDEFTEFVLKAGSLFGLDDEETSLHLDRGAARALSAKGHAVTLIEEGGCSARTYMPEDLLGEL